MDTNRNLLNEDLQVDSIAITHLKETAMWSKLFAIVGLVISVILAIAAFFMGALMESLSGGFYSTTGSTGAFILPQALHLRSHSPIL